jgi:hypothetical protein
MLSFVNRRASCWRAVPLVLAALVVIAQGCGSSDDGSANVNPPGTIKLKPEDEYTYEGTGQAKKKVPIGRRERVKRLHEAAKKGE